MKTLHIMTLPHLGEGVETADVSEVLVSPGDKTTKEDTILVLESEKASMEIPSDISGTIKEVFIKKGKSISAGDKIVSILEEETTAKESPPEVEIETKKQKKTVATKPSIERKVTPPSRQIPDDTFFRASPSVRKLARELKISLSEVKGSGKKERITRDDLINEIRKRMSTVSEPVREEIDFSQWGPIENKPLSKVKKITGTRMESAWRDIPQVTQFDNADITGLDEHRKKINNENSSIKTTLLPFLIKAVTQTLREFPDLNSSLSADKETLVHKKYYHISVAVDTPEGLIVPVVKNADKKDIGGLSKKLRDLSKRAREKKLKPEELKGGTFTISSLGGIGGKYFSPIVNPPQVAILGVSRAEWRPVFSGDTFVPGYILPFSLTYDHRVIDGALAAAFTQHLGGVLSNNSSFK